MWERLSYLRGVARYTRLLAVAESGDASAAILGEVRQLEDRLGLTPMAMRRLQWRIGAWGGVQTGSRPAAEPKAASSSASGPPRESGRARARRLRSVS